MTAREDLVVLIKPMPGALYNNVIAALDEMQINNVRKYAIVDATFEEMQVVQKSMTVVHRFSPSMHSIGVKNGRLTSELSGGVCIFLH
jgi:exosome complex RNA-binding protein Rrp42 (RNase PH superfamily)